MKVPMADSCQTRSRSSHAWKLVVAVVALAALALTFLFTGSPPGSELSGRVTLGDKPIVFGTVTAVASDNRVFTAPILPDGTYVLRNVPPGPVRLAVSSPNPRPIEERAAEDNLQPDTAAAPRTAGGPGRRTGGGPAEQGGKEPLPGIPLAAPDGSPAAASAADGGSKSNPRLSQHGQWFPIPGRYATPATSGLAGDVQDGRTSLNLRLDAAVGVAKPSAADGRSAAEAGTGP
jgi:hypothetical protein